MNNEKTTKKESIPSIESRDSLNALSVSFKPTDVKFLLALKTKSSLEECTDNAEEMIERLHKFVENDHTTEGLDFKYSNVYVI